MTRILHIIESFSYGSAKSSIQLAEMLAAENYNVTVLYGQRDGTELEEVNLPKEITWIKLPGHGGLKHIKNIIAVFTIVRKMKAGNNLILHGHSSYGGIYAKIVGQLLNLKTLYSPRGYSFLREDASYYSRMIYKCIEKISSKKCMTIACGPHEEKVAAEITKKIVAINNGVIIAESIDTNYVGNGILSIGRISYQKGFDILKEIAFNNPNETFNWVGSCEVTDRHFLQNIPVNLNIIPYLEQDKTMKLLRDCRVVLLPSRWEGLSRVLIEALSLGKAIITSGYGSNLDCLVKSKSSGDYENGFSCSTVQEYTSAIAKIKDTELLKKMQTQSYLLAQERYNIAGIRLQWLDLYKNINNHVA